MSRLHTLPGRFVVMSSADQPRGKWHGYRKVAVIETDGRHMPSMIHVGHASVRRIVFRRDQVFAGTSDRCGFAIALEQAKALAARLNVFRPVRSSAD